MNFVKEQYLQIGKFLKSKILNPLDFYYFSTCVCRIQRPALFCAAGASRSS